MKASKLESLVHQLVAAENTIKNSKDKEQIAIAQAKIDSIVDTCLQEGTLEVLFVLDAIAQEILDEKF
jgi:hypothetical protein